jgi:hypothetical protein
MTPFLITNSKDLQVTNEQVHGAQCQPMREPAAVAFTVTPN